MSVENDVRPHGPSKVSRRNLIAGAAVAVPAAAVLNASSAWAKPVVNSLIGMPALQASVSYTFNQLFQFTAGTGKLSKNKKEINVTGVALRNISGETLSVTVTPVVLGYVVDPTTITFSVANNVNHPFGFKIKKLDGGQFAQGTVYTVGLTVTATDLNGVDKTVSPPGGFDVTAA